MTSTLDEKAKAESLGRAVPATPTIAAGQPVKLSVPPELEGKSLLAAAVCRGVTVATTARDERDAIARAKKSSDKYDSQELSLDLPPEADGLIDLELFDCSSPDAQLVQRNTVYREPKRKLRIELPVPKDRFRPGENVELTLKVLDENGRAADDTRLGVRVWNEQLVQQADEQPLLLTDAVRNTSNDIIRQEMQQSLPEVNALAPQESAAVAATPLAAPALRREATALPSAPPPVAANEASLALSAAEPVQLASNRAQVDTAVRRAVARAADQRRHWLRSLGVIAMGGGCLILLVSITGLALRSGMSARTATPAVLLAAASLLIGLTWTGWQQPRNAAEITLAPSASPAALPSADSTLAASNSPSQPESQRAAGRIESKLPEAASPNEPSLAGAVPPAAVSSRPLARDGAAALPTVLAADRVQSLGDQIARQSNKEAAFEPPQKAIAPAPGGAGAVARAASAAPAPPAGPLAGAARLPAVAALGKPRSAAPPAALYFNPQLMTDAQGQATIRFTMPTVPAEYRVMVDAVGHGRIGSQQATLASGDGPAK